MFSPESNTLSENKNNLSESAYSEQSVKKLEEQAYGYAAAIFELDKKLELSTDESEKQAITERRSQYMSAFESIANDIDVIESELKGNEFINEPVKEIDPSAPIEQNIQSGSEKIYIDNNGLMTRGTADSIRDIAGTNNAASFGRAS